MKILKNKKYTYFFLGIALFIYFIVSVMFLCQFPLVHSDEAWLSGLSRKINDIGSYATTESFFNLKPRNPHAIKILFHTIQRIALYFNDYSIFTFRIISLVTAIIALFTFFKVSMNLFKRIAPVIFATLLLAWDIQFIYASHMARQEIFIVLSICICLAIFFSRDNLKYKDVLLLSLVTGISVGFHPNAFVVACMCGCALIVKYIFKQINSKHILIYIGSTFSIAFIFIAISLSLDNNFFANYTSYATNEFGINSSIMDRIFAFPSFWSSLFGGVSGTYHITNLNIQLIVFPLMLGFLAFFGIVMRKEEPNISANACVLVSAFIGVLIGIIFIGRFSQLSIVFVFPIGWLITVYALVIFGEHIFKVTATILVISVFLVSFSCIKPTLSADYNKYLNEFNVIEENSVVLGNLNSEYAFEVNQLIDYRNLEFLDENHLSFAQYVQDYEIEYIIWYDEFDFIQQNKPYYNAIYGNIDFFEIKNYLKNNTTLVHEFKNPTYAMRIVELIGNNEYGNVTIYKVK